MFDLDKAVQNWKRSLRKNPAFEDGDIAELESHLLDEIERLKADGKTEAQAFQKASSEIGKPEDIGDELYKTRTTKPNATPPWKQSSLISSLLPNYFKVSFRNLVRDKLYTGINILGLSIGIISCLFIYLFVQNELSFDSFHTKSSDIYRAVRIMHSDEGFRKVGITSAPFGDALLNDFPGIVEERTRIMPSDWVVTVDDRKFVENRFYIADANIFEVFSWPLVKGDPSTVLERPQTVVLSEDIAEKYFGKENPVGKTLTLDNTPGFEVTGVFRKPEQTHSHIEFDLLVSMETFKDSNFYTSWWWNNMHTYVLLKPDTDPKVFETQLPGFMEKYFGENMAQNNRRIDLTLQPLEDIYFANDITYDWQVNHGSKTVLYMFVIVALLIIGVACINFVNMATARSVNRAREIGIRKTLGAYRSNLIVQFLGEALLMTFIAGAISLLAVFLLNPWFQQLIGKEISVDLFSPFLLTSVSIFLLVLGLCAGSYPALFLSSFQPIKALKEKINFGTSQLFIRKGLIVFQFAISSFLIIGTLIVNTQLDYIANKSLGFQPDQLLNISISNQDVRSKLNTIEQEIERIPGVEEFTTVSGSPGGFFDNYLFKAGDNWEQTHTLKTLFTDENFIETLELEMISGRDFDPKFGTDSSSAVIINKAAADMFGWSPEEALGKNFENQFRDSTTRQVIGVVENFHYESMHQSIAPLVITMNADQREILVKVNPGNINTTISSLEEIWTEFSPLYPIEYFFLDAQFDQLYNNDQRQSAVFTGFSFISIFIACMGLFSLAAFNAEKRGKEMGIRKVLGATFSDILYLFNKEVIIVVMVAFLIAVPATYFVAEQWLQDYAYRIPNGALNYIISASVILLLSLITVSYQSVKISFGNPIDSLKND